MTLVQINWSDRAAPDPQEWAAPKFRVMPEAVITNSTIEGLLVPWDSPTWVADDMPDGTRKVYREGFRRTAVDRQLFRSEHRKREAGRVMFRHMHSRSDGFGPLGIGREFEVRDNGLWGEFHIIEDRRPTLASLVDHGISGLSVEFRTRVSGSEEDEDGVVWRTDVQLDAVALEWAGAYPEAQVLAMRAEVEAERESNAEAERAAEREARERADAEAAAAAEVEANLAAAEQRAAKQRELDAWLVEQDRVRDELAAYRT